MEADIVLDLEDGEIEDILDDIESPEEVYIPLERPALLVPKIEKVSTQSDSPSEPSSDSESDDSDSNSQRRRRRKPKKVYRDRVDVSGPPKKKINSIWCTDAAEDNLTSNMFNCNVNRKTQHERDVETYDPGLVIPQMRNIASNKRNHSGGNVGPRARISAHRQPPSHQVNLSSRCLLPLTKTANDPPNLLAEEIAAKLSEEKKNIIENIIEALGKQTAIDFYEETAQIERNGGLLVMNGVRRRTPGGVYFHLIKFSQDVTPEQIRAIFQDDRKQTARVVKKSKAAQRKEAISKEDYPTLLSRAEAAIYKKREIEAEADDTEEVKNPPPSPATDGRDNSNSSCDVDPPKEDTMDVQSMR